MAEREKKTNSCVLSCVSKACFFKKKIRWVINCAVFLSCALFLFPLHRGRVHPCHSFIRILPTSRQWWARGKHIAPVPFRLLLRCIELRCVALLPPSPSPRLLRTTISKEVAVPLLLLKRAEGGLAATPPAALGRAGASGGRHGGLEVAAVVGHDDVDGLVEDLVDAAHLLATALHVLGAHLLSDGHGLLRRHGRQALRLQHLDARLLAPQVRLHAHEDEGRVRAEVEDFGVPLCIIGELCQ